MKRILIATTFCLTLAGDVKITPGSGKIEVEIDGAPFTTFYIGPDAPKPYLHPLRSASGKVVTRRFPMENVEGETRDHRHHRGLWFTHGDVNGLDFWMNEPSYKSDKKGKMALKKVLAAQGGKKQGRIRATFDWMDPAGKLLLTEDRTMVFHSGDKRRVLDFDATLTAAEKVTFGDTKEGMFAIRLRDELSEKKGTGKLVNAADLETMKNVWGKPSVWVDYSGTLEGEKLGIAIFDHPQNPKHPTYWHARDYGLFAANIFGEHDFYADKTKNGSVTLEPGKSLRFRYRVIIHPGDAESAKLEKAYEKYK